MATTALEEAPVFDRIDEIPFEPERKRLVTVHRVAGDPVMFVKGAPEEVLSRASQIETNGRREPLEQSVALSKVATEMADRGLRVLALAYRVLPANYILANAEQDLVVTALVGFEDPPRPEVPAAVRRCREAGIRIVMVTGDHPHTALAVAREIGLVQSATPTLLTGDDLDRMSDTQIRWPLFENSLITAGIVAEVALILAIDYTAPGNAMFGTAPIGYEAWLVALAFAAAMLLLEEARKAFVRRREGAALVVPATRSKERAATSSR